MPILPRLSSPQNDTEEYPWLYECGEKNCFYRATARTLDEARSHYGHKCPFGVDTMIGAGMTGSILQQAWADLDRVTARLKELDDPANRDPDEMAHLSEVMRLRGTARGMATVLARFMVPHFRTVEEVAREALKRWSAAKNGLEYETPGLGSLKYTFPSEDKYKTSLAREAEKRERAIKGTETVSPENREGILKCKGLFTPEQTAPVYGVSVATVKKIWSTA